MRARSILIFGLMGLVALAAVRADASALAYVLSNGANQVAIFDLSARTVPRTLPTGSGPAELLIRPDNRLAFVSNGNDNTVTFLDLRPGQESVSATVPVGAAPGSMVLSQDAKKLYVANEGSNDVTVLDVLSRGLITTIPVGLTPVALNLSPDGRTVYVVNQDSGSVSLIDTATNTVRGQLINVGTSPNQIAFSPDLRFGYVVNTGSNNVSQLDLSSNTVVQTIAVGANPVSIAFSPDSSTIYVVNRGANSISVVQMQPIVRTITTILVGNSPVALALTSDGLFGFLTNQGSDTVSVIDIRAAGVVDTVPFPAGSRPFAITLDPDENFVYVTNLGSNTVTILDGNTDQPVATIVVGQAPTQFSFLNFPSLFRLLPSSGLAVGATVVEGEGFLPDSVVQFGSATATSVFIEHDLMRATVPPLGIVPVNVLVRNSDGSTTDTAPFSIVSAPTISTGGVTPAQGSIAGGTQVSIAGSGFQAGALVSFGGNITTPTSAGATSLVVTTPAHAVGPVDVAAVNPDGTRAVLSSGFTYTASGAVLEVDGTSVQFSARSGETHPLTQSLAVSNLAAGSLNWTATATLTNAAPTNWLSISATAGTTPSSLVVRADPTGLAPGSYTGSINITSSGGNVAVQVSLAILSSTSTNLVLPHLADGVFYNGAVFVTTLILMNPNDTQANVIVNFLDDDGVPLRLNFTNGDRGSTLTMAVPPRGFKFLATDGSSIALAVGSAQVTSDLSIGGSAIFRQRVSGRPDFEAAVSLVVPAAKLVLAADDTGIFASGIAVANSNSTTKTVRLRIRDAGGPLLGEIRRDVAAQGHLAAILSNLLPTVTGHRTTVEISTTDGSPLAAVGIRANNTGALTTLPVADPLARSASAFLAQVADVTTSYSFDTTFLLFNPANASATTRMDFFDETGNPVSLGFVTGQSGPSVSFPISPLALFATDTNAASTSLVQALGRVTSDLPVAGTAVFRQIVSGRPDFEAAVPLAQPAADVLLFVDNTSGFTTCFALGNATGQSVVLTLIFRDESGNVLPQLSLTLAANAHYANCVNILIPASSSIRGVLEIAAPSGGAVSAIGIRAQSGGALTTLPVLPR